MLPLARVVRANARGHDLELGRPFLPGPVSRDSNPMADRFYALEKLTDAVDALATGAGRVQERLGHAAIHLVRVRPEDISDENLRRVFAGLMDDLSYAQAQGGDEGNIRATMRLTDDEDARAIARRIVDLYHELDGLLR